MLVARYHDEASAAEAVKALRASGIERIKVALMDRDDQMTTQAARAGEGNEFITVPPVPMTKLQAAGGGVGMFAGMLFLAPVGLVIGLLLVALGVFSWTAAFILLVSSAVGGAVAGAVLGGWAGGEVERAHEDTHHRREIALRVETNTKDQAERARIILTNTGADRVA
jgi:hypothetical protein